MKICHEGGGEVCFDAVTELRWLIDSDTLAPTDAGYGNARDLWGSVSENRPVVATAAHPEADIVSLAQYARRRSKIDERPKRSGLQTEIEQLLAAGGPEFAAERILGAILSMGLSVAIAERPVDARLNQAPARGKASLLTRREREVATLI